MLAMAVNRLFLLSILSTSMLLQVTAFEMERTEGGCLQVTLQAGEYIKADPRCIVSRGAGLALRPPPTVDDTGLLSPLRRRIRKAHLHGQQQQRWQQRQQENLRGSPDPLRRLSNTMASNATDCFLAPSFPGDIALHAVSVGSSTTSTSGGESESDSDGDCLDTTPLQSRSRPRSRSSSGQQSGRPRIDTDIAETHRSRRSSAGKRRQEKKPGKVAGARLHKPEKSRKLVVLTQAIVAVGPKVTVKAMPSEDKRRGRGGGCSSPRLQHQQRAGSTATTTTGALSVCEGQGVVALAGYGKLRTLRLRPGQKRIVDSSRAVGWTSGAVCLAGAGGRTSRSSGDGDGDGGGGGGSTNFTKKGAASHSAAVETLTFVGSGTVFVQTHSLSDLRRLLLPKPGVGGSPRGHGGLGFSSSLFGIESRGSAALPSPRRAGVVGRSLKRGLAKRTKAGAKRVLLGLACLALYAVVTALLLDGREGLVNAPRHAVQVARSLIKVARRVATILMRLAREELFWRNGEGEAGGGGGASLPDGNPVDR